MKAHIFLNILAVCMISQLAKAQGNLVVNGGFDTSTSSWTLTNVSGSGYVPAGGDPPGCLYLSSVSTLVVPTASQQITNLAPASLYVVSGEYRSGGKNFATNSFGVALDGVYTFVASSPADYNWHSFSFKYAATSTSTLLSVAAQLNGTGYPYYIDNIVMQPIPSVTFQFSGTNVVLSWPTNALGFSLQSAANLDVASWAAVTNAPAIVGTNYSVTLSAVQQVQFFSLKK